MEDQTRERSAGGGGGEPAIAERIREGKRQVAAVGKKRRAARHATAPRRPPSSMRTYPIAVNPWWVR